MKKKIRAFVSALSLIEIPQKFSRLSAALFMSMLLATSVVHADTWRGTAPFCDGKCLPGEQEIARSTSGDGGQCWSGYKVLCRNQAPTCYAGQTNTHCYGVVLVCDNGSYDHTGVWHSCSSYACGACFGFGKW